MIQLELLDHPFNKRNSTKIIYKCVCAQKYGTFASSKLNIFGTSHANHET